MFLWRSSTFVDQRTPSVKNDPNLFGSTAKRVALTAEHAAAR